MSADFIDADGNHKHCKWGQFSEVYKPDEHLKINHFVRPGLLCRRRTFLSLAADGCRPEFRVRIEWKSGQDQELRVQH